MSNLSDQMAALRQVGGQRGSTKFDFRMEPDARNIEMSFERWADLMDDWGPAFEDVVTLFRMHEKQHFKSEGRSTGRKFRKLSERYKVWKEANYPGRPILVLRGALRAALVEGGSGSVKKVTSRSLQVGIDPKSDPLAKYARAHSRGEGRFGRIPKRPPVRYDPTVHTPDLNRVGNIGGRVPFGSAVGQLFQVYIVKKRKEAKADRLFSDRYDWKKMRRGVLALGRRTK